MSDKDTITINLGNYKKLFSNLWFITTIVLAIILIIILVTGSGFSSSKISSNEAGQKMVDFANSQGATSTLVEVNDAGSFYEVVLSIQGQQVPVYVTKDGKNFTTSLIPLIANGNTNNIDDNTNQEVTDIKISKDSTDPVLGNSTAKITVYEFSDFQCPFCERAYSDTVQGLKNSEEFKKGEINFVYKHFPLNSIHPQAQKAAEASVCAQKQGKFWEYHDTLFQNQNALDIASLKSYAKTLKLNQATFDKCLDSGESAEKVNKDLEAATTAGGTGTPYFVILNSENGKTSAVSGAVPYSQVKSAIEAVKQ